MSRVPGKILIALPQTGSKINFCGEPPLYPLRSGDFLEPGKPAAGALRFNLKKE